MHMKHGIRDVSLKQLRDGPGWEGERPRCLATSENLEFARHPGQDLRGRPGVLEGPADDAGAETDQVAEQRLLRDDAAKVATLLKDKNVPVILTGILSLPLREDDNYDALYEAAAKLQAAGVRFCISTGNSGSAVRNLPLYAGMAAAFGLPKAEALKAVTLYPAQIMNVADRMGSIEPGKMANIVITDGDLLEVRTHVRYLFIDGVRLPLTSRHTELYDAFKDRK